MTNKRSQARRPRQLQKVETVIDSLGLVKNGLLLGLLGIVLALIGETISSEGSTLFALHVVFKYFGVSLFITCGVLLLVEKLPETIEMGDLEKKMESHRRAIEEKNKDGRSPLLEEGSALAHECLQKLFGDDIADAVTNLLKAYWSIPVARAPQRRIIAWLLRNELLSHVSNIATFASDAEAPRFDVRYLGSGPYFTAAVLTAHLKSLQEGDSYFSAGEIWFYLDVEATKDFIDEMENAGKRGVRIRRVFDLNSPTPFNLRASPEEDLKQKSDEVLRRHRDLARDTHGMYELVVFKRGSHGPNLVKRYAVFYKPSARRQLVFKPQNQELGTFTLEYERNPRETEGTERLWQEAWESQPATTRIFAALKRSYAWCRQHLVGRRDRAFSVLVILLGLALVYTSQRLLVPATVEHGVSLENVDQHGTGAASPEVSPGSRAYHAISNAVPAITRDLAYDIGIALQISGIATMFVAPRRRRLDHATELASEEFKAFEKQREATISARNYKSLAPTSRPGYFKLFEEATRMCVGVDDECKDTFVDLVQELDRLRAGQSADRDAFWATAKWALTDHLGPMIESVNTFGREAEKQRGSYSFSPPSELAVMEQLFGELIAHAHPTDSLESLIDFEYFIPTDAERFEMEKLREAVAAGFNVRRIFHCTYHLHAQPAKSRVTESDIKKICKMHKRLQQKHPNYQVRFLTEAAISRLQTRAAQSYGIEDLNQYQQAALKLHNPAHPQAAARVYYLNIKYASDEKQLSLERTNSKDKRITFFDQVWEESEDEINLLVPERD